MQWIETYLNKPEVKKQLGASPERTFESCNMQINQAFTFNGDGKPYRCHTAEWGRMLTPYRRSRPQHGSPPSRVARGGHQDRYLRWRGRLHVQL